MLDALFSAIAIGNIKAVSQLLEKGVDPNGCLDGDGITPLHTAAQLSPFLACQMARLLLAEGANPLAETVDQIKPRDIAQTYENAQLVSILKAAEALSLP